MEEKRGQNLSLALFFIAIQNPGLTIWSLEFEIHNSDSNQQRFFHDLSTSEIFDIL